jgi:outer membrane protein assembly factor BamB
MLKRTILRAAGFIPTGINPAARLALSLLPLVAALAAGAEPWTTYRGDARRSGSDDGKAGPAAPRVLWAMKAKEHFIAAPVVWGDRLFVSGLSFINTSVFYCLDTAPAAKKRVVWTKRSPELELPTVSSPAFMGNTLVFGDGMHQTNGASLYGLDRQRGTILWQLKVPGTLVHLEGSPTVAGGKVYLGGGAAGVLSVDPARLKLEGKEMPAAAITKLIENRRAELQKKYEEAKKKGDPFAVPPTDRDLPKAAPTVVWQAGKTKWHVDAPVAVVEGKVLAASAYLDREKTGERALFCLDAKTGEQKWRAALAINPWGGPSVQGKLVVVSGSSIGYDPAALKGAKGVLAAFDLDTGTQKWRKDLPGGAVSCAALGKDVAVVTCTDGRVRAYNLATGALRWNYPAGAALFAPAALSADTAYVADLKGVVHAINLKSGARRWKLDLAADPAVKAPGMVYAGPTLHAGRLYVVTNNLAAEGGERTTAVVCIGDK